MPRDSAARDQRQLHATPATRPVGKGGPRRAAASVTAESEQLIDLEFLKGLIEAVDNSSIDTVEINRGGTRIRIAKTPPAAKVIANGAAPAAAAAPAAPSTPAPVETAPEAAPPQSNLVDVKSPMVGTFYRSPAPEAPSYVEIGSAVRKGQTLCILEAMKLMNELECEVDGIVREVLADNADPVEYGQVLFRVEPA